MRSRGTFVIAALAAAIAAAPAAGQSLQEEMIRDIEGVRDKYIGLAQAVPEAEYTWRPGEGVRSVGEVYMHVVSANYRLPGMIGVEPPEGTSSAWLNGSAEGLTQAGALEALEASFAFTIELLRGISDERLRESAEVFGRPTNVLGFLMLAQTHLHEHLGQSIAYARTRGVTPPWSR